MKKLYISKNQSNAISYIRAISAIMIVLCHICQGLDNELAWWFNVGVQIFLFMSGFLMAKDYIDLPISFLKRRFLKILSSYYIFLVLVIALYSMLGISVSKESIITYLFCLQGITYVNVIPGLEHLWFVSIILVCYLLTLILNMLRNSFMESKVGSSCILLVGLLVITQMIVNYSVLPTAFGARIGAFILGYFVACVSKYNISKKLNLYVLIATLLTLGVRIYFTYFMPIENIELNEIFNMYFVNWQHTLLGVCIFLLIYRHISNLENMKDIKFINIISKYSYQVYLVHQIFILSPISMLFLTDSILINIVLFILIPICLFSKIVYSIDGALLKILKNVKLTKNVS